MLANVMKVWQITSLVGTLIFLFAGVLPVVSVQFVTAFQISLFDIYGWIAGGRYTVEATPQWNEAFSVVAAGFLIIAVLFPITVFIGLISVFKSPKLSFIAGFLGSIYSVSAIVAVLQLKSLIVELGGSLGALAASFIQIGNGVYVSLLGSAVLLVSYPIAIRKGKASESS